MPMEEAVSSSSFPSFWQCIHMMCLKVKEETEQALSWKQDSILGQTVDFELYAQ